MTIHIGEMLQLQRTLDRLIFKVNQTNYVKTQQARRIASLVEIGELANELKVFKFWSQNKKIDPSRILDEFADVLHFLFSSLLETKSTICKIVISAPNKKMNQEQINKTALKLLINLFEKVNNSSIDEKTIIKAIGNLIKLGLTFGFDWHTLQKAYKEKNKVNITRQEKNY